MALCSANFLFSKSDVIGDEGLEKFVFFRINVLFGLFSVDLVPLEKFGLPTNLVDLFFENYLQFEPHQNC